MRLTPEAVNLVTGSQIFLSVPPSHRLALLAVLGEYGCYGVAFVVKLDGLKKRVAVVLLPDPLHPTNHFKVSGHKVFRTVFSPRSWALPF